MRFREYFASYRWQGTLISSMEILLAFEAEAARNVPHSSLISIALTSLWRCRRAKSSRLFGQPHIMRLLCNSKDNGQL